jgi:RHS repeat-associated protein
VSGESVGYAYDALGRRVIRTDAVGVTRYFYANPGNPMLLTAMRDAAGVVTTYYYDDDGLLFAFQRGSSRYYVATDQVGSPRVVVDAAGTVVKLLAYDAFGLPTSDSAPAFELPIGFAGGLADPLTGLVHFMFRDYDPVSGRWSSRDPARFGGGDFNLYAYVHSNPVQYRDPLGLGIGISGDLYDIIGFEGEIVISGKGMSACVGVGAGFGGGLEFKRADPVARSGRYIAIEAEVTGGPLTVGAGAEMDPCGEWSTKPLKWGGGPLKFEEGDGEGEVSMDPTDWTQESLTGGKGEVKVVMKYCATTLD